MSVNRMLQVVYLVFLAIDVTISQNQTCEDTYDMHVTWVNLTRRIPYRPYVHTSNFEVSHNEMDDCPDYSSGYTIDELSLCPWTYEIHTDYNRYPVNMVYVICNCGKCGRPRLGRQMRCRALEHSFHVIKRTCGIDGLFRYVFTQERLPIACLCAHRPVEFMTPIPTTG